MAESIAYIMSRFPHLPETFILREMLEMEKVGWKVEVFPIITQHQEITHPQVELLHGHTHEIRLISFSVLTAFIRLLFIKPRKFFLLFSVIFREHRSTLKSLAKSMVVFLISIRMAELMQTAGITHIHAHYATHPALAAWVIHQITGIPYSITVHAHDIFVEKPMLCRKLKDSALIIAISRFNQDYLEKYCPESVGGKIHVVHCGIEPEKYTPRKEKSENSLFHLVHVGSLQPYKGQKYLIQACKILQQRGINYKCDLIGGGKLESALIQQIQNLGLTDLVNLSGPLTQDEVATRLPQADCYIQPSIITSTGKMEGIPVGIMEAMASGIPVIATSISGIPELVSHGRTGFLVPPEDAEALADGIEMVYRDQIRAKEVTRQGREFVIDEFNLHKNVPKLSELIHQYRDNSVTDQ